MYNKNNLMRNVLITVDEVLFHAPTKHTVDARMIESSIITAEERFIRPELGDNLYEAIVDLKNTVVTDVNKADLQAKLKAGVTIENGDLVNAYEFLTVDYIALWKNHLWKLVAECVITSAYPEGFVQFGSEGAFHNSPPAGLMVTSGQVTPLISSMRWSVDKKVQDRISPLLNSLHYYICKNKAKYPLYGKIKSCPEDCDNGEMKRNRNAGIALDVYDDDVAKRCCGSTGWLDD